MSFVGHFLEVAHEGEMRGCRLNRATCAARLSEGPEGDEMPMTLEAIDGEYVVLHCEGEVSAEDFAGINEYLYARMDDATFRFQMVDLSEVTKVSVSPEEVRALADQDVAATEKLGPIAVALVATRAVTFGLSRMWGTFVSEGGIATSVFKDLEEARQWLLEQRAKAGR